MCEKRAVKSFPSGAGDRKAIVPPLPARSLYADIQFPIVPHKYAS